MRLELGFLAFFGVNRHRGVHLAIFIHAEKDGAIKAVMDTQDLRHHRHGLLAAILLICGDEHDVPAFAGAVTAGLMSHCGLSGTGCAIAGVQNRRVRSRRSMVSVFGVLIHRVVSFPVQQRLVCAEVILAKSKS